jgi:hypothetical protein
MSFAPFPITPELTAIAIAYKNNSLIADNVLPRVPVGKQSFKHRIFALADGFTVPDTKVGRTSAPNRIEFGFTEVTTSTADYALDDAVPYADIENAPPGYNPLGRATEMLTSLIALDREVRAANLVFNTNSYGASNKQTLSGTSQFSDFTNSDPLGVILGALDACVMRPNIGVIGQAVWTKLRQHPKVVKAVLGNAGDSGVVSREAVAALLELEALYIGSGFVNTAKKGQTASVSRCWGKHISLIYRDQLADASNGTTFGYTAQFGSRVAGSIPDKDIGMRGGERVRSGESVVEVITANDLGYFIQNAVA